MTPPSPTPIPGQTPPGAPADALDKALRALLYEAGCAALAHADAPDTHLKADGSPVTRADRAAHDTIMAGLHSLTPGVPILSEEGDPVPEGGDRWVVDPIDGTAAFLEGLPTWGTTLALVSADGVPQTGALWLPQAADWFYFKRGVGGWRRGRPLPQLTDERPHRRAVVFIPSRLHAQLRLRWPGKARNLGATATHLGLTAAGAAAACFVGPGWGPWDTAAGFGLIEAAGGQVRQLDGSDLNLWRHGGAPFVAGTATAVDFLLQPGSIAPAGD